MQFPGSSEESRLLLPAFFFPLLLRAAGVHREVAGRRVRTGGGAGHRSPPRSSLTLPSLSALSRDPSRGAEG